MALQREPRWRRLAALALPLLRGQRLLLLLLLWGQRLLLPPLSQGLRIQQLQGLQGLLGPLLLRLLWVLGLLLLVLQLRGQWLLLMHAAPEHALLLGPLLLLRSLGGWEVQPSLGGLAAQGKLSVALVRQMLQDLLVTSVG